MPANTPPKEAYVLRKGSVSIFGYFILGIALLSATPLFSAPIERAVQGTLPTKEPGQPTFVPIPAQKPAGIAAASGRMWVTDAGTGEVLELNPATGKLIGKLKLDLKQPQGLAFDGQRLWVADRATRQIVAYDVG